MGEVIGIVLATLLALIAIWFAREQLLLHRRSRLNYSTTYLPIDQRYPLAQVILQSIDGLDPAEVWHTLASLRESLPGGADANVAFLYQVGVHASGYEPLQGAPVPGREDRVMFSLSLVDGGHGEYSIKNYGADDIQGHFEEDTTNDRVLEFFVPKALRAGSQLIIVGIAVGAGPIRLSTAAPEVSVLDVPLRFSYLSTTGRSYLVYTHADGSLSADRDVDYHGTSAKDSILRVVVRRLYKFWLGAFGIFLFLAMIWRMTSWELLDRTLQMAHSRWTRLTNWLSENVHELFFVIFFCFIIAVVLALSIKAFRWARPRVQAFLGLDDTSSLLRDLMTAGSLTQTWDNVHKSLQSRANTFDDSASKLVEILRDDDWLNWRPLGRLVRSQPDESEFRSATETPPVVPKDIQALFVDLVHSYKDAEKNAISEKHVVLASATATEVDSSAGGTAATARPEQSTAPRGDTPNS